MVAEKNILETGTAKCFLTNGDTHGAITTTGSNFPANRQLILVEADYLDGIRKIC